MTPAKTIKSALDKLTVFNTKDQATVAILSALHAEGFRIVDLYGDEPHIPNENTVRLSIVDWRRINRGPER